MKTKCKIKSKRLKIVKVLIIAMLSLGQVLFMAEKVSASNTKLFLPSLQSNAANVKETYESNNLLNFLTSPPELIKSDVTFKPQEALMLDMAGYEKNVGIGRVIIHQIPDVNPNFSLSIESFTTNGLEDARIGEDAIDGQKSTLDLISNGKGGNNTDTVIIKLSNMDHYNDTTITYTLGYRGKPTTTNELQDITSAMNLIYDGNEKYGFTGNPYIRYTPYDLVADRMYSGPFDISYIGINGTNYGPSNQPPTDAGTYLITFSIPEFAEFFGPSKGLEFTISQATNSWINDLVITDWTYGENTTKPTAKASFGDVTFTYSDSKDGKFTDIVPTNAGIWYVKATVADTENYAGLENVLAFMISPKSAEDTKNIIVPDINSDKDVENLVIKDGDKELKEGTDYKVDKKLDGNKVIVTITFKGNYTGTITRTYIVEGEKTSDGNGTNIIKPSSFAVQTGDNTKTGLLATMCLLSAGLFAFLTGKKRKNIKDI